MNNYYTPKEIVQNALETGMNKAQLSLANMLLLGILAGAYIAFGAEGSTLAMHDIPSLGFGRFLAGVIFATGLMMVVICGGELFTGNVLLWVNYLERKISLAMMLRNWFWVYIGNSIGAILLAYLMDGSGLWGYHNYLNGAYALDIAIGKVNLSFTEAFIRGILCNWLVCLAVWMAYAAKDIAGKVLGIFFPIMLFVTSSFEHSVANMYYLAAGLLAKNYPQIVAASGAGAKIDTLSVYSVIVNNLVPVTLGNIVGGAIFVSSFYWYCYLRSGKNSAQEKLTWHT